MQTPFRPLLGPLDWQSCDCNIYGTLGDEAVDLIFRRADGATLRVSLVRDSDAATSRFFRETGLKWQAQERELHADVVEREAQVVVDGSSRPVTVGAFGPGLWAARTDDGAPRTVSLVAEGWPLDDLVLVQVPADAFPVDEDDDEYDY